MNLPPLPETDVYLFIDSATGHYREGGKDQEPFYTAEQVRQAQREAVTGPDGWETNAQYLLDKCPYTVWQRPGAGPLDLLSTLVVTFSGMQMRLQGHPMFSDERKREAVAAAVDVQKLAEVFREAMSWGRSYGTHLNLSPITIEDVSEQFADKAAKAMLATAPTTEGCETCTTHCRADELGRECPAVDFEVKK